jgi:hypothetical protein
VDRTEGNGLLLGGIERRPQWSDVSIALHLEVPELQADLRCVSAFASGFTDLVGFLQTMADDWRGWPGARTYPSMEHDLILVAKHAGHIVIDVHLRQTSKEHGWNAHAVLLVDPGEQMTAIARDVALVFD